MDARLRNEGGSIRHHHPIHEHRGHLVWCQEAAGTRRRLLMTVGSALALFQLLKSHVSISEWRRTLEIDTPLRLEGTARLAAAPAVAWSLPAEAEPTLTMSGPS